MVVLHIVMIAIFIIMFKPVIHVNLIDKIIMEIVNVSILQLINQNVLNHAILIAQPVWMESV